MKSAVVFPRVFLAHAFEQKGIAISMPKIYYPPPILEADKKQRKRGKIMMKKLLFIVLGLASFNVYAYDATKGALQNDPTLC